MAGKTIFKRPATPPKTLDEQLAIAEKEASEAWKAIVQHECKAAQGWGFVSTNEKSDLFEDYRTKKYRVNRLREKKNGAILTSDWFTAVVIITAVAAAILLGK